MAVVKTIQEKIVTDEHMSNSIEYLTRPTKAFKVSYNLCVCSDSPAKLTEEFKKTRIAFNKNEKIYGHQLVQSFSEADNITPQKAHEIGIELMNKCLSNYQVVMATHIDGRYIHNQYIINSVSPFDGKKFSDNKETVNLIRRVSDEICLKHNLTIVSDDTAKYVSLDAATLNLAKRGDSWKFNLAKDLDAALEKCSSKNDFIKFLNEKNYEVKFTDKNISFKKQGEKKSIRADTFAKQFGFKYCKASIDRKLNISEEHINKNDTSNKKTFSKSFENQNYIYNQTAAKEWKRYEDKYKNNIKIKDKRYFNRLIYSQSPMQFTLNLIMYIFIRNRLKGVKPKPYTFNNGTYRVVRKIDYKTNKKIIGNISYKTILNTPGDVIQLKLYSWQIAKLLNNGILLSSRIDLQTGTGIVAVKKFDVAKIASVLNSSVDILENQAHEIKNRKNDYELRHKSPKLNYLVLTKEQVDLLNHYCFKFVSYPKGEKFNIGFSPDEKQKILSVLYPNRNEKNLHKETFFKRNAELNKLLKEQSAQTGEKLCYKVVSSNQYKALRETTLEFAVFLQKDGNYNVVFLEHNKANILNAIGGVSNVNNSKNQQANNQNKFTI